MQLQQRKTTEKGSQNKEESALSCCNQFPFSTQMSLHAENFVGEEDQNSENFDEAAQHQQSESSQEKETRLHTMSAQAAQQRQNEPCRTGRPDFIPCQLKLHNRGKMNLAGQGGQTSYHVSSSCTTEAK